jgi:hypothetical protein
MIKEKINRRTFIEKIGLASAVLSTDIFKASEILGKQKSNSKKIYLSQHYHPAQNIENIVNLLGGIKSFINTDDIVLIKINAQWWNQGSSNLAAIKRFIELVLSIPNFNGEVIIFDNNHRGVNPLSYGAWNTLFEINSDVSDVHNMLELIGDFNRLGYSNVTHYCLIDVRSRAKRVIGPDQGDGYIFCTDKIISNGASGSNYRETILTYPIFTSIFSGITIDFKNGAWKDGKYIDRPIKFINFSGLCYHSRYAGVTSAMKNYFGIVDMSGNSDPFFDGKLIDNFYNFHAFCYNANNPGPVAGMLGKVIGSFLTQIRSADLNITTAEWTGWYHRSEIKYASNTKTIIACTDPVTLDYYSSKFIIYPEGLKNNASISDYLNPEHHDLPLYQNLKMCNDFNIGTLNENEIEIHSFAPTPVVLVSFQAEIADNQVKLSWVIDNATGLYGFEIQRSRDNMVFEKIGTIDVKCSYNLNYKFIDNVMPSGVFYYRLKMLETSGEFGYSNTVLINFTESMALFLLQNFPNPFNNETTIQYTLIKPGQVLLRIYNVRGQNIKTLIHDYQDVGTYIVKWDCNDIYFQPMPAGVYICNLTCDGVNQSIKLILSK